MDTSAWVDEFLSDVEWWARQGARLCGWLDEGPGVRIACPAPWGADECGRTLRVDAARPEDVIVCRRCRTEWTTGRLILVALDGSDEVWVDAQAIEAVLAVPSRTLRHWAQHGKIRRRGERYALGDVQRLRNTA